MSPAVTLTIADLDSSDSRWGIAGLSDHRMDQLGVGPGDVVAVEGARRTVAVVSGKYSDADDDLVRVGDVVRDNADVRINDRVTVEATETRRAERITAAPAQSIQIRGGESSLRNALGDHPVVAGDTVPVSLFGGAMRIRFAVGETDPEGPVVVDDETVIEMVDHVDTGTEGIDARLAASTVTYEDVGGLDDVIERLHEVVELPLQQPELFRRLGSTPQTGVLLYGPTGTGKTLLVRALANESGANFIPVSSPSLMGRSSDSEEFFEDLIEDAHEDGPTLVFFDEVDAIARDRDDASSTERRTVAQLLALLDEFAGDPEVAVVGATNRVTAIDPAFRRGGRFDREIEVGVPGTDAREDILGVVTRTMPMGNVDLEAIAGRTHGYVGADLQALAGEAVLNAIRRTADDRGIGPAEIPPDALDEVTIEQADFDAGLRSVEPSAMREVFAEVPSVTYDDVGGLRDAKRELIRAAEWPLKYPELFDRLRTEAPSGVLLYGPPGTGKTLLAKAVANGSNVNFIAVNGPEVLNKYVGESERAIRDIFEKARQNSPTIVFFDEIDSITTERTEGEGSGGAAERVVSQLLTEIDGIDPLENVLVIAATNRPDMLDRALLRPGRFEKVVQVPIPDEEARREIFKVHLRDVPLEDVEVESLAGRAEGYTGSDIEAVVREASLLSMEEYLYERSQGRPGTIEDLIVKQAHFDRALETIDPSINEKMRERYDTIAEDLEN